MDFFDKLGKQASRTYKYTTEKTSKIAREAKLRMQMNEHKGQIEELYEKIGKRMYENHISTDEIDVDIEKEVEEYFIRIDEICDRIEEERKEILTLKEKKQCPNCFCEIELNYNYCPNCSDKQKSNNYEEFYNLKEDTKKDEKTEQDNDKKIDLNN